MDLTVEFLASNIGHFVVSDVGDTVIDHTSGEPVERTESEKEVETYQIPAHRVVIAARCDWFRRALLSGMRESIDRYVYKYKTYQILV